MAVVDLGPDGGALARAALDAGFQVVGIDLDTDARHDERSRRAPEDERFHLAEGPGAITDADVVLVCVPAPVRDDVPDLGALAAACRTVGAALSAGRLVVVGAAPYPGAMEDVVRPLLEKEGCVSGRDFLLACAPTPPDPRARRVVGGVTRESTGVAALFLSQLYDDVVAVSSSRAAELTVLLEGAFRNVNAALVNELAVVCYESGIDVWEVLEAASPGPAGFQPFERVAPVAGPKVAVGIAQDVEIERNGKRSLRILDHALEINAGMPGYVAGRIADALNDGRKAVKGAQILVLGVDQDGAGPVRQSPAFRVISDLLRRGAKVTFHDPVVAELLVEGTRLSRVELTERTVTAADCVAMLGPRGAYDVGWLQEHARLLFDARNVMGHDRRGRVVRL